MGSICSRMAYLAISRRYYYLRVWLDTAAAPLQLLKMTMAAEHHRVDKYTSST